MMSLIAIGIAAERKIDVRVFRLFHRSFDVE